MLASWRDWLWEKGKAVSAAWFRYECGSLSAAVAFYGAVSLFPLMIVLVSGVGIFFEFIEGGQDARAAVLQFFEEQVSPELSEDLEEVFEGIQARALISGPLAAVGFLIPASLAFGQVVRGFDRIWEVRQRHKKGFWLVARRAALNRLRSLAMVAGMGGFVIVVFFGGTLVYTAKEYAETLFPDLKSLWGARSYLLSLAGTTIAFGGIYRFLSTGPVAWKVCLGSGFLAGVFWEIGRGLLGQLVIGERFSAYGVVGSFLTILLWVYYASMVLFLGALVVRVLTEGEGSGGMQGREGGRLVVSK